MFTVVCLPACDASAILIRYSDAVFRIYVHCVCVCVCVCVLAVGAAYLVCNGMSHFGVLGVFLGNDRCLI